MNHKERAKKILRGWLTEMRGFWDNRKDSPGEKELEAFFHHLKKSIKDDT